MIEPRERGRVQRVVIFAGMASSFIGKQSKLERMQTTAHRPGRMKSEKRDIISLHVFL